MSVDEMTFDKMTRWHKFMAKTKEIFEFQKTVSLKIYFFVSPSRDDFGRVENCDLLLSSKTFIKIYFGLK
jgi:hypothetical protein